MQLWRQWIIKMKNISLANIGTDFLDVLSGIKSGEEVILSSAETHEAVAVIIPYEAWQKTKKRVLGTLQSRGSVEFADDFAMTDEELLQS